MRTVTMFCLFSLVLTLFSVSHAHALEVGEVLSNSNGTTMEVSSIRLCHASNAAEKLFEAEYLSDQMSCENKQGISAQIQIAQIALAITNVGLICSGIGAPASALLGSLSTGLIMIDFVIQNTPCYDQRSSERNRLLIKQTVCETLTAQGYNCNPDLN